MGRIDKGFYRGVEPVVAVSASNSDGLRRALAETIARGNPAVPKLPRGKWPAPIVLKYAGVKSWSAFERGMRLWSITENNGNFQIAEQKKQPDGMWRPDAAETIAFPAGSSADDVIERTISIVQSSARAR
jgi:hypothetical protein